jgi:hypothetical protein
VNVDGSYLDNSLGSQVRDLEVRKGDSIRVFIELTAPQNMKDVAQAVEDYYDVCMPYSESHMKYLCKHKMGKWRNAERRNSKEEELRCR